MYAYHCCACIRLPFDVIAITVADRSIAAKFVSLGATMVELWMKVKHGEPLDAVAGYDNIVRPCASLCRELNGKWAGGANSTID